MKLARFTRPAAAQGASGGVAGGESAGVAGQRSAGVAGQASAGVAGQASAGVAGQRSAGVAGQAPAASAAASAPLPVEVCELCGARLAETHSHLVDLQNRGLLCACRPCWLTMQPSGAGGARFRCVLDRVLRLTKSTLDGAWWNSLQIPVGLVFLFRNSEQRRVIAFYPSPAGATEAAMATPFWDDAVRDNPLLATLAPDVEALLVRRDRHSGEMSSFLVPIDVCYELTGLIRRHWRGFDGGDARPLIAEFFERLAGRARDVDATRP